VIQFAIGFLAVFVPGYYVQRRIFRGYWR